MNRTRIASGLLTVTTLAVATACSSSDQNTPATTQPVTSTSISQGSAETFKPLFQQTLPNVKGKTFTSAIVSFPPGARALPHRHGKAFVHAYVLEGIVRSRVAGSPAHTYGQGEYWVERPGAHHLLTENASSAKGAKLLVVFVSNTGDELKIDDPHA